MEQALARPASSSGYPATALSLLACLAIAFPTLIAFNLSPSATFFNQSAAFIGWGGFLLVLGAGLAQQARPRSRGSLALLASILILVVAALGASLLAAAPWSLSLSSAGTLLSAFLVVAIGACVARAGLGLPAFRAFCIGLVVAGIASSAIGLVQVMAPHLPDGDWIAQASIPGRATGNLRQPNHLSSLLLWSVVAVVWLGEARVIYREIAWMLALLFIEVIVLSASRTGLLGMAALMGWGLFDRRLSRATRILLLASPLAYLLLWGLTSLWSHQSGMAFGGEQRLSGSGLYVSYSRYKIWWNSLALIAQHPWFGVGFGEFNFAWTLTPFPDRPVAFFDHAHNLMLQFAVELGIPLALLLVGLMGYALWQAMRCAVDDGRESGARFSTLSGKTEGPPEPAAGPAPAMPMQRAAFVMVVMVATHSLLEYPLWYSYFLLPAAFAFGLCLERPDPRDRALAAADLGNVTRPWVLASMALILGATLALWDYMRVVIIFAPPATAAPLDKRIADGRRSILFAHHADYAAATVIEHPSQVMKAFERAPHFLLDARLMLAWAKALDEAGETDKARYVAARLKEFHNDQADEFFAACDPANIAAARAAAPASSASAPAPLPFQCSAPTKPLSYRDFK
ncbi:MAG: Wzy polymerase domain-containing protein [Burkholderiales bacterium]|nr:Wzy polymerase domain-containing protein [Burkholderiales bacterium]